MVLTMTKLNIPVNSANKWLCGLLWKYYNKENESSECNCEYSSIFLSSYYYSHFRKTGRIWSGKPDRNFKVWKKENPAESWNISILISEHFFFFKYIIGLKNWGWPCFRADMLKPSNFCFIIVPPTIKVLLSSRPLPSLIWLLEPFFKPP